MKQAYYFTFSRGHVHSVNGFTFDKDVVVVIHAETENKAREIMCAHFGRDWFKPSKWFERLPEGENVPLQVCSRKCIELVEAKREAEGKKKMTVVFPL